MPDARSAGSSSRFSTSWISCSEASGGSGLAGPNEAAGSTISVRCNEVVAPGDSPSCAASTTGSTTASHLSVLVNTSVRQPVPGLRVEQVHGTRMRHETDLLPTLPGRHAGGAHGDRVRRLLVVGGLVGGDHLGVGRAVEELLAAELLDDLDGGRDALVGGLDVP